MAAVILSAIAAYVWRDYLRERSAAADVECAAWGRYAEQIR